MLSPTSRQFGGDTCYANSRRRSRRGGSTTMKLRWLIPLAILLPLRLNAFGPVVAGKITTIVINPNEVTPLHLRPDFVSTIHLPEEVTSVDLGSPGSFSAEHNEGEPNYVYVKPITKEPAQSNLEIAMKSG